MEIYRDDEPLLNDVLSDRSSSVTSSMKRRRSVLSGLDVNVHSNQYNHNVRNSNNTNNSKLKSMGSSYFMNKPALRVTSSSVSSHNHKTNDPTGTAINTTITAAATAAATTTNCESIDDNNNSNTNDFQSNCGSRTVISNHRGVKASDHTSTTNEVTANEESHEMYLASSNNQQHSTPEKFSSDQAQSRNSKVQRKILSPTFGEHLSLPASRLPARIDILDPPRDHSKARTTKVCEIMNPK